jgi:GMP synthase-like glutamine amidotransferase
VYDHFDSYWQKSNMTWVSPPRNYKLYETMQADLIKAIESTDITIEIHSDGVLPSAYDQFPQLEEAFHIIGVSYDLQGIEYIASVEHKKYPIYGVQFHPEKATTIWIGTTDAPHTQDSRALVQHYSNFIVDEARRNDNSMEWSELKERMFVNSDYRMTNDNNQEVYVVNS